MYNYVQMLSTKFTVIHPHCLHELSMGQEVGLLVPGRKASHFNHMFLYWLKYFQGPVLH